MQKDLLEYGKKEVTDEVASDWYKTHTPGTPIPKEIEEHSLEKFWEWAKKEDAMITLLLDCIPKNNK